MRPPVVLALFAAGLLATFALSFGIGRAVGSDDGPAPSPRATTTTTMDPGMDMGGHP